MGLIYGGYGGRSDAFQPGSVSFECGSKSLLSIFVYVNIILIAFRSGPTRRRV